MKAPGGSEELKFPFLFGGAFIEARKEARQRFERENFPSCWEGLSLRRDR